MVKVTINGTPLTVGEEMSILEAAKANGIEIPTLCYLKEINEVAACRICLVEVNGFDKLAAACNTKVAEGMEIITESQRIRRARRMNLQLILSNHNCQCLTCVRNGKCSLQSLAEKMGIDTLPYEIDYTKKDWDDRLPLIRDDSKCIKCMRCISICDKVQSMNVWDVIGSGNRAKVGVGSLKKLSASDCTFCGQCITHCPVGALHERSDIERFNDDLADPNIVTVVQIAPAVRAAWQEDLGNDDLAGDVGKLATALRKLGADYVFDTNFAADLTIMEEGSELLERLSNPDGHRFPMFTSCCPAWVRFAKSQIPDMLDMLSTAKSPQQMFGAVIKTYFASEKNIDPMMIRSVSIMPCVAKKHELAIPEFEGSERGRDVDYVLTTREIDKMIRAASINVAALSSETFDSPMDASTGAAVIFGLQGGVMEAALRSAYFLVTGTNPAPDAFADVKKKDGAWHEGVFEIADTKLRIAVASGLGNARKLIEKIRTGEVSYDFVEIMACPGGCAGGGGQPISEGQELAVPRGARLVALDAEAKLRFSHENPDLAVLYEKYLTKPLSHRAHELLHTDHRSWTFEDIEY